MRFFLTILFIICTGLLQESNSELVVEGNDLDNTPMYESGSTTGNIWKTVIGLSPICGV